MAFTLPPLPYAYDALEPYIDAQTMEIHYTKHHEGYVTKLNDALKAYPDLEKKSIDELLSDLSKLPEAVRMAVRNQGGGHYNHSLFWLMMRHNGGGEPRGAIGELIKKNFDTFGAFQKEFNTKAAGVFGSGWAWLCLDPQGNAVVLSTHNQDTPISERHTPLLGLDVWEHAYYLKYQNKRVSYVDAWWHVINWDQVEENFRMATK